jgi:hypothetical protein
VAALFVVCGILAGVAAYRYGEARATWRRVKDGKAAVRNNRTTAWRHTGGATLYIVGATLLLLLVLNAFK